MKAKSRFSSAIDAWRASRQWLGLHEGWELTEPSDPSPSARHIYRFLCALLKVCFAYFVANWIAEAFEGSSLHRWTVESLCLSWKVKGCRREVLIAFRAGLWAVFSWALFRRDLKVLYRTLGRKMPWRSAVKLLVVCSLIYTGAYIGIQKAMLPHGKLVSKRMSAYTIKVYDIIPKKTRPAGLIAVSRFIIVPLGEELLFRGAILIALLYLLGRWPAVIGSSFLFGYGHFHQWGHLGWFPVVCMAIWGLFASVILFRTGRMRWCVLFHSLHLMHSYLFRVAIPPLGIEF